MLRPSAATIVATTAGCLAIAGVRIATGRHGTTGDSPTMPRAIAIHEADGIDPWLVEGANDTSELSRYATAVVVAPRTP
jgi:hypothetical protein